MPDSDAGVFRGSIFSKSGVLDEKCLADDALPGDNFEEAKTSGEKAMGLVSGTLGTAAEHLDKEESKESDNEGSQSGPGIAAKSVTAAGNDPEDDDAEYNERMRNRERHLTGKPARKRQKADKSDKDKSVVSPGFGGLAVAKFEGTKERTRFFLRKKKRSPAPAAHPKRSSYVRGRLKQKINQIYRA